MKKFDLFKDIVERTGGDIYIGVVGPVRAGKSTFVKKFMELIVIPNIPDSNDRSRAKDELPQCGAGKVITTAEPKFIPSEAIEITIKDNIKFRVRLVDNVGYTVKGALGYEDEKGPRMVATPWFETEIPFQEAAEIGTKKVIEEHSTLGLVITTDGTVTEISREDYIPAEERIVAELKAIGKPFVMVLNTAAPYDEKTENMKEALEDKYDVPVLPVDCQNLCIEDIYQILEEVLFEFPIMEINIQIPSWVQALKKDHWLRRQFEETVRDTIKGVRRLRDMEKTLEVFKVHDFIENVQLKEMDLGLGTTEVVIDTGKDLFYKILSESSGMEIAGEKDLLQLMGDLTIAKKEYDKVAKALEDVQKIGYGIVPPQLDEMSLEEPKIVRQGARFGIKLRATAPSVHMIRTDINAEVSPIIGTEKQSEELINYLISEFESNPSKLWKTNLFGKSLNELVREGIQNKIFSMPESAQDKIQEALQRIVNEGCGGLICIII